jgi:DNA-binding NarL/FixJ family response regulator
MDVLPLLAAGLSDKEIARQLVISQHTVHHHVSAILRKLGAASRGGAATEAIRLGLPAATADAGQTWPTQPLT